MSLLVMDTVGAKLMLGLISHDKQLIHEHHHDSDNQNHHSATLIPQLKALLNNAQCQPSQLSGIVVNVGPGSFTGIRTALTAAKLMGQWANIPIIPLTTHQFWAMDTHLHKGDTSTCTAVLDARRGRGYIGQLHLNTMSELKSDLESDLVPRLSQPIVCQPVTEMAFNSHLIIASEAVHTSISKQIAHCPDNTILPPPELTSPQIVSHWLQHLPCTTAEFIARCGQPWKDVQAVYGQQPNITLPKAPASNA